MRVFYPAVCSLICLFFLSPGSLMAQGYPPQPQPQPQPQAPPPQQEYAPPPPQYQQAPPPPQYQQQGYGEPQQQYYQQPHQPRPPHPYASQPRLFIGPVFGFGGTETGKEKNKASNEVFKLDNDMMTTFGGLLQFEAPVHEYVVLGARGVFKAWIKEWESDQDYSRHYLFNVDGIMKFRFAFPGAPGEIYAGVPIGLSVNVPSSQYKDRDIDADIGLSWNMSVVGGFNYLLFGQFGLFGELGWMLQNISMDGKLPSGSKFESSSAFSQLALNFGIVIPF